MGRPDFYGVHYKINPYMRESLAKTGGVDPVILGQAIEQWENLVRVYQDAGIEILLIPPIMGLPDIVFTANSGFVFGNNKIVLSRFRYPERWGEEAHFERWFASHGYEVFRLPAFMQRRSKEVKVYFEGSGDAFWYKEQLVCAYGEFRTSEEGVRQLAEIVEKDPIMLRLVKDEFYHLDTCFCPSEPIIYYPGAFDRASCRVIENLGETVAVSERDAKSFVCNNVFLEGGLAGRKFIGACLSRDLKSVLVRYNIESCVIDLSEFIKSGGGARCLTLFL